MYSMFKNAKSFNRPLNNWKMSNVKSANYMFENATSFDQSLEKWDVHNIYSTNLYYLMFLKSALSKSNWKKMVTEGSDWSMMNKSRLGLPSNY